MIHENYTSRERKKDRLRLKVRRDELRETLAAHRAEYRRHLQDAADEDGIERRLNVERARLAGKEYEVTRRQYRRNDIMIATHLIIEFAAEVEKTLEGTQQPNHLFTVPFTSHTVQVYDIYEECA